MNDKLQHAAADALRVALRLMTLLTDDCTRLQIAGSLRRGKAAVGDVELVAAPRYRPSPAGEQNLLDMRLQQMIDLGLVKPRLKTNGALLAWGGTWSARQMAGQDAPPAGSRYKAFWYDGLPVDIFIVLPDRQWGPTLLLRTGPGDANQVLMTERGRLTRNGDRGICPPEVKWIDAALYREGALLHTPDERSVFAACGLPYIEPHDRDAGTYHQLAYAEKANWTLKTRYAETVWEVEPGQCTLPPLPPVLEVPEEQPRLF
jgi:DNA polymerase/3'-5' exonuclease PolX